jgi:hypothetical protein
MRVLGKGFFRCFFSGLIFGNSDDASCCFDSTSLTLECRFVFVPCDGWMGFFADGGFPAVLSCFPSPPFDGISYFLYCFVETRQGLRVALPTGKRGRWRGSPIHRSSSSPFLWSVNKVRSCVKFDCAVVRNVAFAMFFRTISAIFMVSLLCCYQSRFASLSLWMFWMLYRLTLSVSTKFIANM